MENKFDLFKTIGTKNLRSSASFRCEIAVITPEVASKILTYSKENFVNRPIQRSTVERYMIDLENNNWILNGQPLIFDHLDRLVDGQHRLHACVNCGKPIVTYVLRDKFSSRAFDTMDSGTCRSTKAVFALNGIKNAATVSRIVTNLISLNRGYKVATSEGNTNLKASGKFGNKNILHIDTYKKNPELFQNVHSFVAAIKRKRKAIFAQTKLVDANVGGYMAYLHLTKGYEMSKIEDFFNNFFGCLPTTASPSPIVGRVVDKLRRLVQSSTETNVKPATVQKYVAFAWNCYIKGQNPRSLKELTEADNIDFE